MSEREREWTDRDLSEWFPPIWCDRKTGAWESNAGEVCQDHAVLMPCPYNHGAV